MTPAQLPGVSIIGEEILNMGTGPLSVRPHHRPISFQPLASAHLTGLVLRAMVWAAAED